MSPSRRRASGDFAPLTSEELLAIPAIEISDPTLLPTQPLVSVLMITWRHERWIEDAIAGVVAQRCLFPIELLLGEDRSPDGTFALCRAAQARHPGLIRLVHAERNVGAKRNMLRLRIRARGRYLAFCEGDDYWTDPLKLAKQVAMLESDAGLSGCATMVAVHAMAPDGSVRSIRTTPNTFRPRWQVRDLLNSRSQPHTCSLVYRNGAVLLPRWFINAAGGHKEQLLLHANAGAIACLPDVTAVYRHHGSGMASGASRLTILCRETFRLRHAACHLAHPETRRLAANLVGALLELAGLLADRSQGPTRYRRLRALLAWMPRVRPRPWNPWVQAVLGTHAPRLHRYVYRRMIPHLQASVVYQRLVDIRLRRRRGAA